MNHHHETETERLLDSLLESVLESAYVEADASGKELTTIITESLTSNLADFHVRGILNETTYKEIVSLIDGNFLSQRIRAKMLKRSKLEEIKDDGTMVFKVPSSEYHHNHKIYDNIVKFDQWDAVVNDMDFNANEAARILLWAGDIRLHCDCPSFLYHGYAYLITVMDADIVPEDRPPKIRNPKERGIVCKHLNLTLQVLPFNLGKIASKIKKLRKERGLI
ncbi:MAG: hypothetical protein D6698_02250 [Gammaproteobacteria bacterium]|nr:MAG: hypothetical protein D6698_02250 [Gammaproteobacteria bacterium]